MLILYTTERDYPWGTLRSTHASKVKIVLEEKRVPYRVENLPPGHLWKKPPEMLARHPLGKVPYIEDGAVTIYDSTVIDEYLEDKYPLPRLLPADPAARARVRELEQFADEALLAGNLPPIWMPYWSSPEKRDREWMEKAREALRQRDFPYLEKALGESGERGYMCGEFSMADVPMMAVAMVMEVDAPAMLAEFPRIDGYLKLLRGRKSYRAISPQTKVADAASLPG